VETDTCNIQSCTDHETTEPAPAPSDEPQAYKPSEPRDCYWTWSPCSSDCEGIRTRQPLCQCSNYFGEYDDSFCVDSPPFEYEPCNTHCNTNQNTIQYWQKYSVYGSGDDYKPWPINETTLFECFRRSPSTNHQMNWYQILTLDNIEHTDLWLILAQEYILFQLNNANIHNSDSNCDEILKRARWVLGDCNGFSESDKGAVQLLIQVLKDYNSGNMNNTMNTLEALSLIMGHTQEIQSPHYEVSSTLISLLTIGSVMGLSVVLFFIWKKRKASANIFTLAPEFDLPDPNDELIPGTMVYESGGEEDLSYELGELDEVDLVD